MLLHADNFNYYGDDETLLLDGVYAQAEGNGVTLVADPDGISTQKVMRTEGGSSSAGLRYVLPAATDTVGFARRLWMQNLPSQTSGLGLNTANIVTFRDGSNATLATAWVTTTGAIVVSAGAGTGGTVLGQTSGPAITASGWYHLEIKYVRHESAGTVEVRVEGIPVITATGLNTGSSSVAQLTFGNLSSGASGGVACYCKDLVVWDGSGAQNNDFMGSVLVYELLPTADSSFPAGWTSTGANGFSVLDNNPPDDGVSYISADDSPPAAAEFELSDLPVDVTSVRGLVTRVRAAKSDGGDGQFQVSMVSGVSEDAGADRPITVAQTYWSDVSELDPATSNPWLPSAVNAALLKIDRTA